MVLGGSDHVNSEHDGHGEMYGACTGNVLWFWACQMSNWMAGSVSFLGHYWSSSSHMNLCGKIVLWRRFEAAELQRSSNSMHVEGSYSAARRSWDLSLKYDGVESMDGRMTYWTSIFGTS